MHHKTGIIVLLLMLVATFSYILPTKSEGLVSGSIYLVPESDYWIEWDYYAGSDCGLTGWYYCLNGAGDITKEPDDNSSYLWYNPTGAIIRDYYTLTDVELPENSIIQSVKPYSVVRHNTTNPAQYYSWNIGVQTMYPYPCNNYTYGEYYPGVLTWENVTFTVPDCKILSTIVNWNQTLLDNLLFISEGGNGPMYYTGVTHVGVEVNYVIDSPTTTTMQDTTFILVIVIWLSILVLGFVLPSGILLIIDGLLGVVVGLLFFGYSVVLYDNMGLVGMIVSGIAVMEIAFGTVASFEGNL